MRRILTKAMFLREVKQFLPLLTSTRRRILMRAMRSNQAQERKNVGHRAGHNLFGPSYPSERPSGRPSGRPREPPPWRRRLSGNPPCTEGPAGWPKLPLR